MNGTRMQVVIAHNAMTGNCLRNAVLKPHQVE